MTSLNFSQSNSISLVLPTNPSFDIVASALSLKLSLEQQNKKVDITCPDEITVDFNRLVGVNTITKATPSKNLIISFPGQTNLVEKVSYSVENDELQLVIVPKTGSIIDTTKIKIIPGGVSYDLSLVVGSADFGVEGEASCLSQITAVIIKSQNLPINPDIATNLMQGLTRGTNGFTNPKVDKNTFEAAAWLMASGARHQSDEISAESFPTGSIPVAQPQPEPEPDWYEPKIYRGTTVS